MLNFSRFFLLLALLSTHVLKAGQKDSLFVHYFENPPFSYSEGTELKGIEIDILNEYVNWLKLKKNISLKVGYKGYTDFEVFLNNVKTADKSTFGLGTLTINQERKKELDFTSPVLKNVAFCITNGHAPDVKVKTKTELLKVFGNMTAITIPNSSLNGYVLEIKKLYVPELKISYQANPQKILDEISKNVLQFGYVDAVSFWVYLKKNPGRFLKMQKALSQSKEELAFVLPKGSEHTQLFNEFFEGPNGFKFSKHYRSILEKHLGSYMTQNMAIY
ncbi:MAG: transporter substrate-binding domain-containing protein [Bacteroidia bacterium]|nr:transporter substrate-binding domain-containing protein [Bacteroidia bacterium]